MTTEVYSPVIGDLIQVYSHTYLILKPDVILTHYATNEVVLHVLNVTSGRRYNGLFCLGDIKLLSK